MPPSREDGTEELEPKNLNADFDDAASDIIEVDVTVDKGKGRTKQNKETKDDNDEEKEPAKRPRRSTPSTRSTGSAGPEAKAKAKAKDKAGPRKVPKTAETPKDVEKKALRHKLS